MQEELKVRFNGDATSIESSSDKAVSSLNKVGGAAAKVSQTLSTSSAAMARNAGVMGGTVAKGANQATQAMTNFGRVLQDAPYGFIGISNNLNPLLESFQRLKTETGTTGGAIKALAGSLIGGGGLGLALSAVTAIMSFASVGFSMWTRGMSSASKASDEASKANEEYKKSVQNAFSEVAQEATKVEVLVAALKQGNLTYAERKGAIEELKRIAPSYFAQLDAEKLNIDTLNLSYKNYLKSLQNAAEAKVLEKQLEGIIEKRLELEKVLNPPQFTFDDKGNRIQNVILETVKTQKIRNENQAEYNNLLKGEEVLANRLAQLKPKDIITPDFKTPKVKDEKQKIEFLFDFLPFDPSGKLKPEQKAQLESSIDKFQKEFSGILKGVDFARQAKTQDEKIKLALEFDAKLKAGKVEFDTKALTDAIHKSIKPEDLLPQGLDFSGQLKSLEDSQKRAIEHFLIGIKDESERLAKQNVFNLPLEFNLSTDLPAQIDLFKTRLKQFGAAIPKTIEGIDIFGNPIELKLEDLIDTSKISNKDALDALRKAFEGIKTQVVSYKDQLNSVLKDFAKEVEVTGLVTIGESIAAALTGGDIGNVFKQFGGALGSAVQSLGKQMIALSTAALLAKKAIKSLFTNPVVGIAAGIALVAVGAALKNLLGGGIKGFAKGGLVPGTGNGDTVPALLTPGEFVVTKDKAPLAQRLFGNGNTPRSINGIMGYAQGGLVRAVDSSSNSALGRVEQVPYIAGFDISHDKVRLMINRANNFGNTFGR
jgi:hypothetical protein